MMELRQRGDIPIHFVVTDVIFPESERRGFAAPALLVCSNGKKKWRCWCFNNMQKSIRHA
jgi:hypothetical protein